MKDTLSYFLPEKLLDYFKIVAIKELGEIKTKTLFFEFHLEEKNILPQGYNVDEYESKGFYPSSRVQDFPIRGKAVYLVIKRRRWRDKATKKNIIQNDYSFIAEGSKLTNELSAFLKDTGRYKGRYNK